MAKLPTKPLTVVGLQVDAFKRIRAAHVTPSPTGLVAVRGRNRQGKSSLIQAMQAALEGKRAQPDSPINRDAHTAEVVVDLGEIIVRKKYTRDSAGDAKASLTVTAKDGSPFASPQAILDALVGKFADPVAFLDMKPEDQVKTVLSVTGLDGKLATLEAEAKALFDQRRDLGRDKDMAVKALAGAPTGEGMVLSRAMQEFIEQGGTAETAVRVRDAAREHNASRARMVRRLDEIATTGRQNNEMIRQFEEQIVELQKKISQLSALNDALRAEHTEIARDVAGFVFADEDTPNEIIASLDKLQGAQAIAKQRERLAAAAEAATAAHAEVDTRLVEKRAQISALLQATPFPVPGMSYDPERKALTLNGIPFSEASQAEAIEVAAAVAMAGSPTVKVMFARNGSLLDAESLRRIASMADAQGFQLWMEIVDSSPDGPGIFIEDGEATQADAS